jgi:NAD(P)-dependent dehydrogenase (short-subunit alcohol dehydrogenase family)
MAQATSTGRLAGKVTLVTGGSTGIGRSAALAIAREGSKVVVSADRSVKGGEETVAMIREAGGEATFIRANIARSAEVEALIAKTVETYGALDCAFNNAGVEVSKRGPAAECPEDEWDRVVDVNLKGTWLCMKYEIPEMLKAGAGAIVNTSSTTGLRGYGNISPYVASKHGIVGLTKAVAVEYGQKGVRVNCLCPGGVMTPQLERILATGRKPSTGVLGRFGKPEEVAEVVVFLLSKDAVLMHGHALPLDGGLTMMAANPG